MEYQINLTKAVVKEDLPKLKKSGINMKKLEKHINKLKKNPYICSNAKSGDLADYRAINWGSGYRILFTIKENPNSVIIAAIDKHDDAYRKIKKRK